MLIFALCTNIFNGPAWAGFLLSNRLLCLRTNCKYYFEKPGLTPYTLQLVDQSMDIGYRIKVCKRVSYTQGVCAQCAVGPME